MMDKFKTVINGMTYTIELCHDGTMGVKAPEDGDEGYTDGICDYYLQRILLLDTLPEDRLRRVLYHELAHAYLYEAYRKESTDYTNEEICIFTENFIESIYGTANAFMQYHKGCSKSDE